MLSLLSIFSHKGLIMLKINKLPRFIISATALLMFSGTSCLVNAFDDEDSELGSVTSTATTFPSRAVQFDVSHPDGLKKVSWYNVNNNNYEDSKAYSNCPKSDTINLPQGSRLDPHIHHHHYVVIIPCKGDTETFKATRYDDTTDTDATFVGVGNTVENDNSSVAMEITDINLDGLPDIVVVDSSSGLVTPTIMLGNGDGTFEEIVDGIYYSDTDPNTPSTPPFNVSINPTSGPSGTPVTIKVTGADAFASVSVLINGFGSHGYRTNAAGEVTIPETIHGSVGETVTIRVQIAGSRPPYPLERTVTFKITGYQQNQISDSSLTVTPALDFQRR